MPPSMSSLPTAMQQDHRHGLLGTTDAGAQTKTGMTGNGQGVHAAMVASLRAVVNTQTYGAVRVLASAPTLHDIAHSISSMRARGESYDSNESTLGATW